MTATAPVPPRLTELLEALAAARAELHQTLEALPRDVREAPPADGRWSAAQVVEHLVRVEDGIGRLITKLIRQAQADGGTEADQSWLASLDHHHIVEARRSIEAPDALRPGHAATLEEALAQLTTVRDRVIASVSMAGEAPLSTVGAPHPFLGPLNGYQWILFLAHHERRHTRQIRRLHPEATA